MVIRSRAPLRIGLAGGGTDLKSYSDKFGGVNLNVTLDMYAYCTIIPTNDGKIKIDAYDNKNSIEVDSVPYLPIDGDNLILHRAVYNKIVKDYNNGEPLSFKMVTSNDAPVGSGLGTSSTMMVAIIEAFNRWLKLDLTDYQKAELAYEIERVELNLAGGMQDQYTASFGGFNFMEFKTDSSVIVNPLRLEDSIKNEFESSLLLYFSGKSRSSANQQVILTKNLGLNKSEKTSENEKTAIDAMGNIKQGAYIMKDHILTGNFEGFAECLRQSWENKKKTSSIVSNKDLEETISYAMSNGAEALKVSGAGGGGFLLLYCNPINRPKLINALEKLPGRVYPVRFSEKGASSWIVE